MMMYETDHYKTSANNMFIENFIIIFLDITLNSWHFYKWMKGTDQLM